MLNTIAATMRTEQLLQQSQALAEELQNTNAELQEKAQLLAEQNTEVEAKNREIEQAKHALEEKAEQLALTSKYKSEFLANMSHELRTPLNNLLILARVLADNTEGNLSPKQIKFAETIHSSGTDLLALINDILDLSKIESGKMDVEVGNVRFEEMEDYCVRTFRHVAEGKNIGFAIEIDSALVVRSHAYRREAPAAGAEESALQRAEVHGAGLGEAGDEPGHQRLEPDASGPESRQERDCVFGDGYRHRHRAGKAAHHLRSVPAGGRNHQPEVRRHRPGSFDQPRTGAPAGRRNSAAEHRRPRQHLHAVPAAGLYFVRSETGAAPKARWRSRRARTAAMSI